MLELADSNKQLIEKLLEILDKNTTAQDTRHQLLYQYLAENGVTCRRVLVEHVSVSRVNANRVLRRLLNCGLVQEKMVGFTKQFVVVPPDDIDVLRVSSAYAVLVMQHTYEDSAAKFKEKYGTMP